MEREMEKILLKNAANFDRVLVTFRATNFLVAREGGLDVHRQAVPIFVRTSKHVFGGRFDAVK